MCSVGSGVATGDHWGIIGGSLGDHWGIIGGSLGDHWGINDPQFLWACSFYSSEAKDSRVIICKFPVKLPFPVHSVLQRALKSRHVHSNRVPGRLAGRHFIICACVNTYSLYTFYSVLGLRSVMTTAFRQ